ncbi:MAG TPA: hypothetical protein VK208_23480, partial [Pyrinomonadaceae bacterium]|nr:hypothetical protein [Pyrinomonadaceae bacterium]
SEARRYSSHRRLCGAGARSGRVAEKTELRRRLTIGLTEIFSQLALLACRVGQPDSLGGAK